MTILPHQSEREDGKAFDRIYMQFYSLPNYSIYNLIEGKRRCESIRESPSVGSTVSAHAIVETRGRSIPGKTNAVFLLFISRQLRDLN